MGSNRAQWGPMGFNLRKPLRLPEGSCACYRIFILWKLQGSLNPLPALRSLVDAIEFSRPLGPRLRWGARSGRSSPHGFAWALELLARASLGSVGCLRLAARTCWSLLGRWEVAARVRSALVGLGFPSMPLERARFGTAWVLPLTARARSEAG